MNKKIYETSHLEPSGGRQDQFPKLVLAPGGGRQDPGAGDWVAPDPLALVRGFLPLFLSHLKSQITREN